MTRGRPWGVLLAAGCVASAALAPGEAIAERLRAFTEQQLSERLGAQITIERVTATPDGLRLENVVLPEHVTINRARLFLDWDELFHWVWPEPYAVELSGVAGSLPVLDADRAPSAPLQQFVDSGIDWLKIEDLNLSGTTQTEASVSFTHCAVMVRRTGDPTEIDFDATGNWQAGFDSGSLRARGALNPEKAQLAELSLHAHGADLDATGTLDWTSVTSTFELTGALALTGDPLQRTLSPLSEQLPQGTTLGARRARADFAIGGPLSDSLRWYGDSHFIVTGATVRGPGAKSELELKQLSLDAERTDDGLRLDNIRLVGEGLEGSAKLEATSPARGRLSATLRVSDLATVRRLAENAAFLRLVRQNQARPYEVDAEASWTPEYTLVRGEVRGSELGVYVPFFRRELPLRHAATDFEYRSDRPDEVSLNQIRLEGPAGKVSGAAELGANNHRVELELSGFDASFFDTILPGTIERGSVDGTVTFSGTAGDPLARVSSELQLENAAWHASPPLGGLRKLELSRASGKLSRDGRGWQLPQFAFEGSVQGALDADSEVARAAFRGSARIGTTGHHLELEVSEADARWLGLLDHDLPGSILRGTIQGSLTLDGDREAPLRDIAANVELSDAAWRVPKRWPAPFAKVGSLPIGHASAKLVHGADGWRLSDAQLTSPYGHMNGEFDWNEEQHHADLSVEGASASWLSPFVPGRVEGGELGIDAELRGTPDEPLERVSGSVRVKGGRWIVPPGAEMCARSVELDSASADYRWTPEVLSLGAVNLQSEFFGAEGDVEAGPVSSRVHAVVHSRRAGELFNLFPDLAGLVRGGQAAAAVDLDATELGLSGRITGQLTNAWLTAAGLDGRRNDEYPVRNAEFGYQFQPGQHRLERLTVRGPELNANLHAHWSDHGSAHGGGRLWLTRQYGDDVTGGTTWFLRLLGYPRIDTTFTLSGTPEAVFMHADIVDDWRWHLIALAAPERVEKLARGRLPLVRASEKLSPWCSRDVHGRGRDLLQTHGARGQVTVTAR